MSVPVFRGRQQQSQKTDMSGITEKLLSKAEEWSYEPVKIRKKLKANCTPALKKNDSGKRPGPLVVKPTSDIQLILGSSTDGEQDKTCRPCRTPSPSSNTNEFTFLTKPAARRPLSPPVRRRSPVRNRSRSPTSIPVSGLKRIPSPSGSLDNLQIEAIKKKVKKVQRARLYLLQRPGPNSLLIAGDSPKHKYKVIIGPQTCSCGRGPHCIHILFVMLRVFQVSENDPCLFSKDLKNFEVEALFSRYDEKRNKCAAVKPVTTANSLRASSESTLNNKGLAISVGSRSSSMNDIRHGGKEEEQWCPICLLEMLDGESLVTCLSGCKNKLHHHCVVIWSEECKSQNEPVLCPLCRALWTWPDDERTSVTLAEPTTPISLGHTNYVSSPPSSRDNISSLSPVPSLPSVIEPASTSSHSLSSNSLSSTTSMRSQSLDNSSTSLVKEFPTAPIHGQPIADNYVEWARTFGEEVVAGVRSRDWTTRENTLRRLCSCVVTTLSQYANEGDISSTAETHPASIVIKVCCSILSTVAADPVYRVYISCLRCLRALLACTACRSNSDLVKLQDHVRPVVEAIILKCADGNRRTSQLSLASLIELCRGSSGELAVGRQTRFLAENGLGGVTFVLSCILDVSNDTTTLKWQWLLSRLYALDRLMEEFPQEFYLLYVEKLAKDLGCYRHGGSHLVNYDRLMSVLLFSVKGFNHRHATVRKIARRVFIVAARLTSHVQGVFTQVCDMLEPVDAALQAKLKHRLCTVVCKSDSVNEIKRECSIQAEVNDSKVIYTSVRLPSRRNSFGRNTPSSPTQFPDRSLILEKLGKDLFMCCDCSSPNRTLLPPRLRRSASYTASPISPCDIRTSCATVNNLASSSVLRENFTQCSPCQLQEQCDMPRQRPNFLPLPANSRCSRDIVDNSSFPCARIIPVFTSTVSKHQCGSADSRSTGIFRGISSQCTDKPFYHRSSSFQQQCRSSQLHRSVTRRSSEPVSSSQCPVGDLIDLSIPLPSEMPRSTFPQLSFKSEIVTPTTPVSSELSNIIVSSANQSALHRKKEMVYEDAVTLVNSLKKLSIQSSLPNIPGLTDIPFESTKCEFDNNEDFYPTNNKSEVTYLEGAHWIRGPLLGTGAFSSCFQARDIKTGTLMAVKQISICCSNTDSQNSKMENIHDEIMMMTKLDHPNVVRLLGATQQGSFYNMFVEWMPGGSVAALLDRYGPFTEDVMLRYLHQVLAGLAYLHEKQILHRDLKGANLLVDSTGHYLRIGDFGAAARLASQRTVADEFKGQLLGTIAFMAPEVLRGEGYGRSSDVWSVGCIIIEMSTTKPPWDAVNVSNDLALLFKIACSRGPPPIPESLPPGIRDIALRCLEQNSGDRPPAKELLYHACFSILNERASSEHRSCARL